MKFIKNKWLIVKSFLLSVRFQRGATLIEVCFIIGIVGILAALATVSLHTVQQKTYVNTTIDTFTSDIKAQQIKAMVGDMEGGATGSSYGIHFDASGYTLFRGATYTAGVATNFTPSFPVTLSISSTFSDANIVFAHGSGEVGTGGTVTFTDTATNEEKTVTINRYGVVTGVD